MRRSIIAVSLALPAVYLCSALVQPSPGNPPCDNLFPHEPVVMYEVHGNTLCCLVDVQMTVWGDGFVRAASAETASGRAQHAYVDPLLVQDLVADLGALGAGAGCDVQIFTSDVPLETLTILRGTTDGRARTWSWLGDDGHNGAVSLRLNQFLQATFPGF